MNTRGPTGPRPTDEELMQLLDGEIDEVRHAVRHGEVTSWLDEDADLQAKVDAMTLVGDLLRSGVAQDDRADGIADAVMAKLVDEAVPEREAEVVPLAPRRLSHYGQAEPANQNARSVFWLAGVAAAVAFGLFFWGRGGVQETPVATGPASGATEVASGVGVAPGDSSLTPKWISPGPAAVAELEDEPGHTVEVAAVDFGSHSGSVFYVSAGLSDAATTTAVVWVTEDVGVK